jgi:putative SOS response-associated peptidase YedK
MCGRYTLRTKLNLLLQQFAIEASEQQITEQWDIVPRFNIAPTQQVPVIRQIDGKRELSMMRWGLVPPWAESPGKGAPLINAMSETAAEKPTFRSIIKNKRCLIPADGFFEWETIGKKKQPHYFGLRNFKPFAFAGLWQAWNKSDPPLQSCTILTTRGNDMLSKLHARMPVILSPNDYDVWLSLEQQDPAALEYLYEPPPANEMETYLVDAKVNKVANQGADCIEPLAAQAEQPELF